MRKLIITGSRNLGWESRGSVAYALKTLLTELGWKVGQVQIVHGACYVERDGRPKFYPPRGVDAIVHALAEDWGFPEPIMFHADWLNYGKAAGPIRNQEMIDSEPKADACLGMPLGPSSKGTLGCMARAVAAGIPTYRWEAMKLTKVG